MPGKGIKRNNKILLALDKKEDAGLYECTAMHGEKFKFIIFIENDPILKDLTTNSDDYDYDDDECCLEQIK